MKSALRYLAGISGPSGYGSKSTAEQVAEDCASPAHHLTAIITGATSGIGAETARALAKVGVRLVLPARNLKKASEMKMKIQNDCPSAEIILLEVDLSSLASVKRCCNDFLSLDLPLHILINNAGIFSRKLEFSIDKIEMTFAINYIGHFLMTDILLDKMIKTAAETGIQGRIVNLSSVIHTWVSKDDFYFSHMVNPNRFNGTQAYAQTKLANIMHAKEVAKQLNVKTVKRLYVWLSQFHKSENLLQARKANVTINAVHPGIVKTKIIRRHNGILTGTMYSIAFKLLKSPSQGASTTCFVALSTQTSEVSGGYYADCNKCCCSSLAKDEKLASRLWQDTHSLIWKRIDPSDIM